LAKVSRLDQPTDILAEISRQAKSRLTSAPSPPPPTPASEAEKIVEVLGPEEETDIQDVAETMRRSGHLWMKIASKYAVEVVGKSPKRGSPATGSPIGSPAAKKSKIISGTATPPMDDVTGEFEGQRQKLVEVK
jgi:hypothetical protein